MPDQIIVVEDVRLFEAESSFEHLYPPGVDEEFGHWLAGWTAGEGCFRIHRSFRTGYPPLYVCHFQIKVRDDDEPILRECAERTGVGKIRPSPPHGNGKPLVIWVCHSLADCQVIAAVFDRYPLRAKKANDYAVWREALIHLAQRRRGDGYEVMAMLYSRIQAARKYPGGDAACP